MLKMGGVRQDHAEKYKFIIVAPDSRTSDFSGWSVPSAEEPPSPDMLHTQVCACRARSEHGWAHDCKSLSSLWHSQWLTMDGWTNVAATRVDG